MRIIASINGHPKEKVILTGKPVKGKVISFKRASENPWAAKDRGIVKGIYKWGIKIEWV